MTDQNCAYCMEGDLVAQFGIKICELPSSKVYLFKEQIQGTLVPPNKIYPLLSHIVHTLLYNIK